MSSAIELSTEGEIWEGGGERYRLEKVVGNGAFGVVWRARDSQNEQVAIKKVVLDRRYHNRELEMMKQLEHRCVIRLRGHFEKPGRKREQTYLHLVMDFLPATIRSVAMQYHKQRMRFPPEQIRVYLYQALTALEYVHGLSICHRDLKPDNFCIDPARLTLKLIDFGCAKMLVKGGQNVSYICSRYYRAPELLFGATEYTLAVDMWSVGTILAELLLGHLPFQGQDSTQQHLIEIMKLLGTPSERELRSLRATVSAPELPKLKPYPWERIFPQGTSPKAIDLTRRLLTYDPTARKSASRALSHPFFEGVRLGADGAPLLATADAAADGWDAHLQELFDDYARQRSSFLSTEALPALERSLAQQLASDKGGAAAPPAEAGAGAPGDDARGRLLPLVKAELTKALRAANRGEAEAMRALGEKVRAAARGGDNLAAGDGDGGEGLAEGLGREATGGAEASLATEVVELRRQLKALQAQLYEATSGGRSATAQPALDAATTPAAAGARRRNGERGRDSLLNGETPTLEGALSLEGGLEQPAHGRYAPDYLGQVTPLGAIRDGRKLEIPSG